MKTAHTCIYAASRGILLREAIHMTSRIMEVWGGSGQLVRAQAALSQLSGVVAAEFVPGRDAVRVYCGEDMTRDMLSQALMNRGIRAI